MDDHERPRPRLGLRFTIRDLIWLTLVVALAIAWWMSRRELERARLERLKLLYENEMQRSESLMQRELAEQLRQRL